MRELSKNEMISISGEYHYTTVPELSAYVKLFKRIFKFIKSWF